jgi:hypothetical protein
LAEGVLARDRRQISKSLKTTEGVLARDRRRISKCLKIAEGVLARDRRQMFQSVSKPQKGSLPGTNDECFKVSQDCRRGPCPGPKGKFCTSPRQQKGSLPRFPENAKLGVVAFALATLPWGLGWQLSLAARSNGAFSIGGLALPAMLHILRGAASFLTRQKYN